MNTKFKISVCPKFMISLCTESRPHPPALRTTHYSQGRRQTPADAPPPLKRSMLTPFRTFGGPRPRFGAKARECAAGSPFQTALITD